MKRAAIVIGGGLSGLATAAKLAYLDYSVTVLEKNEGLGGRARIFKKNGFIFDMGPSWYMMPEVMEEFFKSLNKRVSDYYDLIELKTKYRIFSDTEKPIDLVSNLQKNLKLFDSLEPGSKKVLLDLIDRTKKAYSLSLQLLASPFHSVIDFFNLKTIWQALQLLYLFNPFQSYERFITKKISHPILQKILQFHTVFLGGTPLNTPALYSILIAADFTEKIWYPIGGLGQLPRALQKICQELGVKIITGAEVTELKINSESSVISEVITNTGSFTSDVVINTADYAFFDTQIVPKEYREYSKEYWDTREYAISSVLVYLGISKKLKSLAHHNFYFQEDWNEHFSTIQNSNEYPQNPCFYVCAPSVTDSSVAPEGKENLFILIPVSVKTKTEDVEDYVSHVLEHIEEKINENFIADIEYQKIFAQSDFAKSYNAYKGNALGIAHTLLQSVLLRPRMQSEKIDNLYFAGQFTQPGIGVPMVLLSADYVVAEIEKNVKR